MLMIRKSEQNDGKREQQVHTHTKEKKTKEKQIKSAIEEDYNDDQRQQQAIGKKFHWIVVFIYNVWRSIETHATNSKSIF